MILDYFREKIVQYYISYYETNIYKIIKNNSNIYLFRKNIILRNVHGIKIFKMYQKNLLTT